jgi:hypothetical protein
VHTFAATIDAVAGAIEAAIAPAHDQATAVSCPVSEQVGSRPLARA